MKTLRKMLLTLAFLSFVLVGAHLCSKDHNVFINKVYASSLGESNTSDIQLLPEKVYASSLEETSTPNAQMLANSTASSIELIGADFVYRSSEYIYSASCNNGFDFITFEIIGNGAILDIAEPIGGDFYTKVIIDTNALLYSTFELRATGVISGDITSKTITVLPLFATEIDEIVLNRNDDHETLDEINPIANPGDTVHINIRSFKINQDIYGLEDNVTFTDYAVVLDSSSTAYARVDPTHRFIIIYDNLTVDNPVILFSVVVIQPGAPIEYRNLVKEMSFKIDIPVTSFEVIEKSGKASGMVDRNQSFEYIIKYNSNNVASLKGYTTTLYDRNNKPLGSSPYFSIDKNINGLPNLYGIKINISKTAPFGSYLKIVISSIDNPSLSITLDYDVKLLESNYTVKYSKDYSGTYNDGSGIQLIESNNLTQLRNGYNADILLVGSTTGKTYTPQDLRNQGLTIDFPYTTNNYFTVNNQGMMSMSNSAPAHTNGTKSTYSYAVKIIDGAKTYSQTQKQVEVFKSLSGSSYSDFSLSGSETVRNGGEIRYTSYTLNFATQGDFTADKMSLNYTTNDSYFKVYKDYVTNTLTFSTLYPEYCGDSITITVSNGVKYNNQNIDSTWSKSITVLRRFVASGSQLNKIRYYPYSSYRIVKDITYSSWTPISSFSGIIDGNDHLLTMTIYQDTGNIGFVGINNGVIKNLSFKARVYSFSENLTDWRNAGVVAGINKGTIDSCYVKRYYTADSYYTVDGNIYTYHNVDLDISGNTDVALVGGITGLNEGNITNCRNYTNIFGRGDIGGIAGRSSGYIYNSDNSGRIFFLYWEANRSIGGVVGYQSAGTIDWSWNYSVISYDNTSSSSRTLQPKIGYIVGHKQGTVTSYNHSGTVDIGTLHTETWTTGIWPFRTTHTWNQALYAGNRAFGKEG